MQSMWRICLLLAVGASTMEAPRLYELNIETSMPHLEENLRYTTERSQRCLSRDDLASAFPILHHPSLAGCELRARGHDENTLSYQLVCDRSAATTGRATWHLEEHIIRGTLEVKLGGKNMTFSQRITGRARDQCASTGKTPV